MNRASNKNRNNWLCKLIFYIVLGETLNLIVCILIEFYLYDYVCLDELRVFQTLCRFFAIRNVQFTQDKM